MCCISKVLPSSTTCFSSKDFEQWKTKQSTKKVYWFFLSQFWNNNQMFELSELSTLTTIGFVWVVTAVILSITDEWRESTKTCAALKAPRLTLEFGCFKRKTEYIPGYNSRVVSQNREMSKENHLDELKSRNVSLFGLLLVWYSCWQSTHGSQQVHPNRPHNHPLCHTSTRKGCTHLFHSETVSAAHKHRRGELRIGLSVDIWPSRLAPVFKLIGKMETRSKETQNCEEPDLTGGAVGQAGLIVGS